MSAKQLLKLPEFPSNRISSPLSVPTMRRSSVVSQAWLYSKSTIKTWQWKTNQMKGFHHGTNLTQFCVWSRFWRTCVAVKEPCMSFKVLSISLYTLTTPCPVEVLLWRPTYPVMYPIGRTSNCRWDGRKCRRWPPLASVYERLQADFVSPSSNKVSANRVLHIGWGEIWNLVRKQPRRTSREGNESHWCRNIWKYDEIGEEIFNCSSHSKAIWCYDVPVKLFRCTVGSSSSESLSTSRKSAQMLSCDPSQPQPRNAYWDSMQSLWFLP